MNNICLPIMNIGIRAGADDYPDVLKDGNTVAWFDMSSEYITMNGSNQVSQWSDRSVNGNHLLQAGADGIKPTWSATGLLFDGTDDFLAADFALDQPEMVYAVLKQVTWTLSDYIWDGNGQNAGGFLQNSTPSPNVRLNAGTGTTQNSNLTLDTFMVIRALYNGASSGLQINETTKTAGNCGSNDMEGFTLGCRGDRVWAYSNIVVKEVIIRSVADATGDELTIFNYLKDKYSL